MTITLRYPDGDKVVEVKRQIDIHGFKCALHRCYENYDSAEPYGWAVSEISTGMKIALGKFMADAIVNAIAVRESRSAAEFKQAVTKGRAKITRRNKKLGLVNA